MFGGGESVREGAREPTWDELTKYGTYIFDCDGVIWGISEADTKTAVDTINHLLGLGKRVMFVTNNSNKRRSDFLAELTKKGINFGSRSEGEKLGMMISASYTTARYLAEKNLRHPFVITSDPGLLQELQEVGINEFFATIDLEGKPDSRFESPAMTGVAPSIPDIISSRPEVDCIVVGWDHGITGRKVGTAVNYIRFHEDLHKGKPGFTPMPIIACSGDASGVLGTAQYQGQSVKIRAIGNGAMASFVAQCFDPVRQWEDMGKPSDALLEILASPDAYGVDLPSALMVGDTLQTDIVFGNRGRMDTLLVLTGVTTKQELEESLAEGDELRTPTFLLPKLGHFAEMGKLPPL
jgi:phosphoglycolate phosphatase